MKSLMTIKFVCDKASGVRSASGLESLLERYFKQWKQKVNITGASTGTRLMSVSSSVDPDLYLTELSFLVDTFVYGRISEFVRDLGRCFEQADIRATQISTNNQEIAILLTSDVQEKVQEPKLSTRFLHKLMSENKDEAFAVRQEQRMNTRYEKMLKSLQTDMHLPRAL